MEMSDIAKEILGASYSDAAIIEMYNLPEDTDIETEMADQSVERCTVCDCWCETANLVDDYPEHDGICGACLQLVG